MNPMSTNELQFNAKIWLPRSALISGQVYALRVPQGSVTGLNITLL
jgi:hypothetical protein